MEKVPSLHISKPSPKTSWFNRVYTLVYLIDIFSLVYRHCCNLMIYRSPAFTCHTILLLVADIVLALLWITKQAFFINPVRRQVFPENLSQVVAKESDYPGLDVFVCTADPFKEPPIGVLNTVLSVLAYEYPTDKLSVYVSDDGGSQLTLFAFIEAAKFAKHWLPFCKKYNIMDRSPEVYFGNDYSSNLFPETNEIQGMYKSMKAKIQGVVDQVPFDQLIKDAPSSIKAHFNKWSPEFTRHQHRTIIQVLLKNNQDKDVTGNYMPNLIYLAREKNIGTPHHFKAGALNTLIRVSNVLTNAPIFLVLDCDMYSNDPKTPLRTLCYFMDPGMDPKLAFVQFPQRFHNINRYDTYGAELDPEMRICTEGMDGLGGTMFMGSGGFFRRQALLEKPTDQCGIRDETNEPGDVLALAHRVASCMYEVNTKWGSEIGFRYGVLTEDIYTGFHLQCLGWKSVICNPTRAAFLGHMPIALKDFLSQSNRWYLGLLQAGLSKYSPLTYGFKFLNPFQAICYANLYFRAFWSIPIIIYAFLPQLALLNSVPLFPKVLDPWCLLYIFLFLGAYGNEYVDYVAAGSDFKKWWNSQRMWLIMGSSSWACAIFSWLLTYLNMSALDFNVTSKVSDIEKKERYEKGIFEFGVELPLLLPINVAAIINLFAFLIGIKQVLMNNRRLEEMFVQLFIAGFVVVNSWPIYEGMVLRSDKGRMPTKITLQSFSIALVIYLVFRLSF
uniref:cellulose synthase-like protein G3 isoform X2 n=1 Tax=Erigeron canadensis TaxID=72917 RepID=UPI001CB90A12|nr:cellulose synthase-like protein G3 isoform X2 [Erigeron canadensis]